ncbi:MAG TPA: type II toxin-antitoxin system RelE/ParE family toxin [Gammaproteobacteria bacterium]|nr:type II toxin-antitoxin system RelE/ParE family toxin [Gammaproteobacteria bacterium]
MIKNIVHKGLKRFFTQDDKSLLNAKDCQRISRILDRLDAAVDVMDMNLPGYNLHKLTGNMKGLWSVKVSVNWRITFRFENGDAHDVNLEDYH